MLDELFADLFDTAEAVAGRYQLQLPRFTVRLYADDLQEPWRLNGEFECVSTRDAQGRSIRFLLVHRSIDDAEWTRALRDSPSSASLVTGRGAFPVRWWPPDGHRRTWAAEYCGTGHRVLRLGQDMCLLLNREGPDPLRYAQRVLREILIHTGRRLGFLMVHAAVVAFPRGRGLAVLGKQGAGKTDLALRLCRQAGGTLVGVDRLLLGLDDRGRLMAIGLPFGLNIAFQTWQAIGTSLESAKALGRSQQGKVYVDQRDFVQLTGIAMGATCEVTRIGVLSERDEDPFGRERLEENIAAHCLYGRDPGYLHDWLGLAGDPSTVTPQQRILESWPLDHLVPVTIAVRHRPGGAPPPAFAALLR